MKPYTFVMLDMHHFRPAIQTFVHWNCSVPCCWRVSACRDEAIRLVPQDLHPSLVVAPAVMRVGGGCLMIMERVNQMRNPAYAEVWQNVLHIGKIRRSKVRGALMCNTATVCK